MSFLILLFLFYFFQIDSINTLLSFCGLAITFLLALLYELSGIDIIQNLLSRFRCLNAEPTCRFCLVWFGVDSRLTFLDESKYPNRLQARWSLKNFSEHWLSMATRLATRAKGVSNCQFVNLTGERKSHFFSFPLKVDGNKKDDAY